MFRAADLLPGTYNPDTSSTWIRPAGILTSFNENIKEAFAWAPPPPTPPEQKRFSQSTIHEPGKALQHWGQAQDPKPQGPFGVRSKRSGPSEDVATCMSNYPDTELSRWTLDQAEGIYASSKREPLGRPYIRGHKMPEGLGTDRAFGRAMDAKNKALAGQGRDVIFPTKQAPSDQHDQRVAHQLYVRSHAAYDPGEQRRRDYRWETTAVDPATHRFGAVDKADYRDGVKKALQPSLEHPAAVVASKIHEDYKLSANDFLGRVRKLGAGERAELPPDHTYGMPSMRLRGEPGVDQLIQGSYSEAEQQPDANLGKALREGWRNVGPDGRTFGVPSVRTDLPLPRVKSVANYGSEPDAFQLLRPPRSVERGIHEAHFMALRSRSEIQELVHDAEIKLGREDFDRVFQMAVEADGEYHQCCLVQMF